MANTPYSNFYLANEIEDQYNSHLDLLPFCTVNNTLEGTPGMIYKVNRYSATNGTEKVTQGNGNTLTIGASFTPVQYTILCAQNRFGYYDEEEMTDPLIVTTGTRHMATDMFNTVNGDIFAEFNNASLTVAASNPDFGAFADAVALMDFEQPEGVQAFAFASRNDMAKIRKLLGTNLQYVEAFARSGYVGTVAGVNLYVKKDATDGVIVGGTKEAVTVFNKKGVEVEQKREPNTRYNEIYSRKYYVAALTDATKAFKITF